MTKDLTSLQRPLSSGAYGKSGIRNPESGIRNPEPEPEPEPKK